MQLYHRSVVISNWADEVTHYSLRMTWETAIQKAPSLPAGSINFLAYPVLEVGGKRVKIAVEFSFTRPEPASLP